MTCVHHWQVETPSGPTVGAICKNCGSTRTYRSSEPEPDKKFRVSLAGDPRTKQGVSPVIKTSRDTHSLKGGKR